MQVLPLVQLLHTDVLGRIITNNLQQSGCVEELQSVCGLLLDLFMPLLHFSAELRRCRVFVPEGFTVVGDVE